MTTESGGNAVKNALAAHAAETAAAAETDDAAAAEMLPQTIVEAYHARCGHSAVWTFTGKAISPELAARIAADLGRREFCPRCKAGPQS